MIYYYHYYYYYYYYYFYYCCYCPLLFSTFPELCNFVLHLARNC